MYELRNHTPHPVRVVLGEGGSVELPPESPTPRCVVRRVPDGLATTIHGVLPLTRTDLSGEVIDLPPVRPEVLCIVARAVVEALPDRSDLVFPDDLVRDAAGRVVGCRSLGRIRQLPGE